MLPRTWMAKTALARALPCQLRLALAVGYQRAFGPAKTLTVGVSTSGSQTSWGVGYGMGW